MQWDSHCHTRDPAGGYNGDGVGRRDHATNPCAAGMAATPAAVLQAVPPTAIATPTAEVRAEMVTSTTKRLIATVWGIGLETNLPWAAPSVGFDKRTIYENLIGVRRSTGELIPEIAKEWSDTADGLTWSFLLRDDVPFHGNWGNVTSRDVNPNPPREGVRLAS